MPNPAQSHTNAMGAFKFPSSPTTPPRRSTEPSSPSPPPYLPAGFRGTSPANTPGRSKRKGLPMRSPSMSDSQDQSPGVIFQLPFGAQGTRRFSSVADHNGRHSGITPPPVYPSPATSSTQSAASFQAGADASGPEHPPLEPVFTRGLGIHLQGQFTEERVPHPFDTETANQKASAVELPGEAINDQCMPTPRSDSPRVSFKDAPAVAKTEDPSHSRPLQPATPIAAFSGVEISSADSEATTAETNTVYGSKPEAPEKANGPSMGDVETMRAQTKSEWTSQQPQQTPTVNQEQSLQVQDTAATSENTTSTPQNDSATMPLWAQRQLSIRRQSLIPRPELDFVRGSGILPAASKDLVLPEGGAIILTYPVLLSDVVKVAQDDAHDRSEGEQDSAEAAADSQHASAKTVKRRKTSQAGKRRESVSAASGTLPQEKEAGLYNGAVHTGNARRLAKPAIVLPEAQGAFMAMVNGSTAPQLSPAAPVSPQTRHSTRRLSTLGSPVEISTSSTFETNAHTRRGSKVAARRSSQQDLSSEGESDRSGSQQDSSEAMVGGDPNEQHAKGKARKRELLPKAIAAGKIAFRKNSVHAAGPMHSPMDVDLDLNRSHSTSDLASSRAVQKRHLQEEYGEAMPSTPQQKKAKKGAGSQQNRAHQLATPQSDRHHAASPGLNEDFELASTLLHMHDGVIIDSPSRADSSHRLQLPVSKKPRTPKSLPPKPAKAVNGSPKKTPAAAPKPPRTPGPGQKHCEACGATETPCWRPGYTASTVLCNSCGLRYKKSNVYCTKLSCKYIPLKTEYAAMEAERVQNGWDHLRCQECGERVALPIPRNAA
ncbi:DNA-binding transcription repressor [Mortierella alpina]|nr:DNA-binding transcription repressor [Mortierella alpina]